MKSSKKSMFLRVVAMALSVLMIGSVLMMAMPLLISAADESTEYLEYPISGYTPGVTCYEPIPLLVVMVNFDADGDGVDDNPDGTGYANVKDNKKDEYGEQWCHTTEQDWVNILFKEEGRTLNTYYEYMSDGKFKWLPAQETYGEANNGVISVVIDNVHPNCIEGTGQWVHCFNQIVEAASQYVDFSVFDVNGDGILEKYELCLCFILGGAETSSGATNLKEVFGFHAYYKDYDKNNYVETDGVGVGRSGFFGTGAISGGSPLRFGVFAHELGHYLGAPDYYDTKGTGYDRAVNTYSIMASGAHGDSPAHFDPYTLSFYGFVNTTEVNADGEYTLYSKASSNGKYNVLKISTPNPGEYYLVENRYATGSMTDNFDGGVSRQGIIIWHVDENIHAKTGMTCNDEEDGYDPALVVYPTRSNSDLSAVPATSVLIDGSPFYPATTYPNFAVFEPAKYKFPVSETWYTSMTAEEAALVENLKVEVISSPGTEMTVRVTGSYDLKEDPEFAMTAIDLTQTSFGVSGRIDTLNYSVLEKAEMIISEVSTGTVVKTESIKFAEDYTFNVSVDGLKANTEYKYEVAYETDFGTGSTSKTVYTRSVVIEKAVITMVINSDFYGTTTTNVNVGSTLTVRFPMEKKGYTFEGWYLDAEYTQKYEFGVIESPDPFTIYAKWVEKAPEQTTTNKTTTADNNTTAPVTEPGASSSEGPNFVVIAVVIASAVVVVGAGVALVIVVGKKKK